MKSHVWVHFLSHVWCRFHLKWGKSPPYLKSCFSALCWSYMNTTEYNRQKVEISPHMCLKKKQKNFIELSPRRHFIHLDIYSFQSQHLFLLLLLLHFSGLLQILDVKTSHALCRLGRWTEAPGSKDGVCVFSHGAHWTECKHVSSYPLTLLLRGVGTCRGLHGPLHSPWLSGKGLYMEMSHNGRNMSSSSCILYRCH